jgi:hypothetical protein
MPNVKELLDALSKERSAAAEPAAERLVEALISRSSPFTAEEQIQRLQKSYAAFDIKHQFKPGQIVRWKTGLQNKRLPRVGDPAIVMSLENPPLRDPEKSAGSAYFNEPLDVALGLVDSDGDFVTFLFDSRRFEPWT